jgi:regulator of protease activity HflC (stomatin/prohibitin superfamily)
MSTPASEDVDLRDVGPWGQAVALSFRFLFIAVLVTAAGWLASNFREVPADSQAVVVRFGAVARVQGPGLLLAWPKPIEQVTLVPGGARQIAFPIARFMAARPRPARVSNAGYAISRDPRLNSAFLLTGDSSVVHLEAQIFYQVVDPVAYMIAGEHIAPALQRVFIASAIDTIAGRDLDAILVARPENAARAAEALQRERLRSDLMNAANRRLRDLADQGAGLGIRVSRVDLVPSIPAGAKDAFDSVLIATQQAERAIASARTQAQLAKQKANQDRDRIIAEATATADETVTEATTRTASILALAHEAGSQGMSREVLMSRLYADRVGGIIRRAGRVEIVGRDDIIHTIVPGATWP